MEWVWDNRANVALKTVCIYALIIILLSVTWSLSPKCGGLRTVLARSMKRVCYSNSSEYINRLILSNNWFSFGFDFCVGGCLFMYCFGF